MTVPLAESTFLEPLKEIQCVCSSLNAPCISKTLNREEGSEDIGTVEGQGGNQIKHFETLISQKNTS